MLNTAVLFLVFNRPEIAARVFEAIRSAKPKRLYIAADGPRSDRFNEATLCQQTRRICSQVDWDCEIKTLFREENLGCRYAVSRAIDWFFEHEEEGIILEDDCLPNQSFFHFCADLLKRYRSDRRIMCISGDNFQQGNSATNDSYYFSKYNHCWGWATWRRAWLHFDPDITNRPRLDDHAILEAFADGSDAFIQYWKAIFEKTATGEINSWAYLWTFSCWIQNGLTCTPDKNLVMNIGFGSHATHTKNHNRLAEIEAYELPFPLTHPATIVRNITADRYTDCYCFGIQNNLLDNEIIDNRWKRQAGGYISHFRRIAKRLIKLQKP